MYVFINIHLSIRMGVPRIFIQCDLALVIYAFEFLPVYNNYTNYLKH